MKKRFGLAAGFIAAYLVFVIAMTPASWLVGKIALPKNIVMVGIEGSIWNARAKQVIVDDILINNLDSSLSLLSVLMFNPALDVRFGDALVRGPEGILTVSGLLTDLTIDNASVMLPANMIASRLNTPIDITAHSQVNINVETFVLGAPVCNELQGEIQWKKAVITALDEKVALGDLSAKLACEKGALVASVEPKNNLGLTYKATLKGANKFSGSGYLKPGAKFPAQLRDALSFIGQPDNQGRYRLKL